MILKIVFSVILIGYLGLFLFIRRGISKLSKFRMLISPSRDPEMDGKTIQVFHGIVSLAEFANVFIFALWVIWMFGLIEINWIGF